MIIDEPPLASKPSCNPQALASGDAVSPSSKPLGIPERPQPARDEQEADLQRVERQLGIVEDCAGVPIKLMLVVAQEPIECPPVAALRETDAER